ncbi:MAG: VWA domain-containing protein [Mycobacteriales bacterium]
MSTGEERLRRWRLALGGVSEADGAGLPGLDASADDQRMDEALGALYDGPTGGDAGADVARRRAGGLGASSPRLARWLGDIRTYFPSSVVQVMQRDAVERLNLTRLLLEPELLEAVEPDVHLVGTLLALHHAMPEQTVQTARQVVATVVEELRRRFTERLRSAVAGALDRSARTHRPRHADIDWPATIHANLRHYQPEYRTVIPERLVGYGRRQQGVQRHVILAVDQSASMASSVVYASVYAAALASIRSLRTSLVVFDTAVVDLTEQLADPVEVLFGTQLGGGTDINRALGYCQRLVDRPTDTVLVLISDLYEGGDQAGMIRKAAALARSGVQVIALLALSDEGRPSYDSTTAAALATLGIPAFACTPDRFPDLMAAALERRDLSLWHTE